MWLIQLLLAWALLYVGFRLMIGIGKRESGRSTGSKGQNVPSDGRRCPITDAPDALRPDIEDEFDPTDYI